MRAQELIRHRFSLQAPTGTSGYTEQATARGSLAFSSGSEALKFGTPSAQAQWKIGLRYRTDVKADWILVERDEGRTFHITALAPDKVDDRLWIFAVEGPQ